MAQDIGELQTLYDSIGNPVTLETVNGNLVLHVANLDVRRALKQIIKTLESIEQHLEEKDG